MVVLQRQILFGMNDHPRVVRFLNSFLHLILNNFELKRLDLVTHRVFVISFIRTVTPIDDAKHERVPVTGRTLHPLVEPLLTHDQSSTRCPHNRISQIITHLTTDPHSNDVPFSSLSEGLDWQQLSLGCNGHEASLHLSIQNEAREVDLPRCPDLVKIKRQNGCQVERVSSHFRAHCLKSNLSSYEVYRHGQCFSNQVVHVVRFGVQVVARLRQLQPALQRLPELLAHGLKHLARDVVKWL